MIVKLSRLLILALVVVVASATLPYYYKISFGHRVITPMISYSPVISDFLVSDVVNSRFFYKDRTGREYSRTEADELLPLQNYRVLLAKGLMPDSVQGVAVEIDSLRKNYLFLRVRPRDIDGPGIDLYPLFESRPPRFKLTLPQEFFTINQEMVFTNAATNKRADSLSNQFTAALKDVGFTFPAQQYFGNPTTRKAFDEGYFILDSAGKLFQVKKINGRPFCKAVPLPESMRMRHMIVYENSLREFYGMLITEANEAYLLLYDQYKLQHLDIGEYNALQDEIILRGNIVNRQVSVISNETVHTTVFDRRYQKVADYSAAIGNRYSKLSRQTYDVLFPFVLSINRPQTYFVSFHFSAYSYIALFINALLTLSLFFWRRYRNGQALRKWYDFVLVLLTGLYGYIAVMIYENTDL